MIIEKKISVVIPCYNDAEFVEYAIDSILNQSFKCHEIIVVDDGSNKETKEVLKKLSSKISSLITQENKGQSTARNVGVKAAMGKYILVLDSDDYFDSSFCELAIPLFKDSETKLVTCYANWLVNGVVDRVYKPSGGTIEDFLTDNRAASGSVMFKKEDWETCGGYDESMNKGFEDWEFYISLLKNGGRAEVIQKPLFFYRKRGNSTTSKANKIRFKLIAFIYKKHYDLVEKHSAVVVNNLLIKLEREEKEKNKNTQRIDFRIGKTILYPFRKVKSIFKK